MITFKPQSGIKPLLPIFGFLTLLLIPTFIILFTTQASIQVWIILLILSYSIVMIAYLIAQKTTKYWIEGHIFHYKSTLIKGKIDIFSIRKLEINANNWLNGKPASSNIKGIYIYYEKYNDTFVTPENNSILVEEFLKINPTIETIYIK